MRVRIPTKEERIPHPAAFRDAHIKLFAEILDGYDVSTILDPFAGVGKIHDLRDYGYDTYGIELEPEWANQAAPFTVVGSVLKLGVTMARAGWPQDFDVCITSPCFGNRMADHHEAKDDSVRNTYRHKLGRPLSDGSAAGLQWGQEYRDFHRRAWERVSEHVGTLFILHIKDHVRKGQVQAVSDWHAETIQGLGWKLARWERIGAPGQRFGENHELRVDHESVIVFERGKA